MTTSGIHQSAGFVADLSPTDRDTFMSQCRTRHCRAVSTLMCAGTAGTEVIWLVSGRVKVTYVTEDGREVILDFRGPGELLGEMAVIDGNPTSSTVTSVEAVEVVAVS